MKAPAYSRASMWLTIIPLVASVTWLAAASDTHRATAPVRAESGMVASAHALASDAGLSILRAGGNAVDAAVAAAFAIAVVEPQASGLGGEGLMVIYRADRRQAVAIDYRSVLPGAAHYESRLPQTGHAAVAVPGTVAGLSQALYRYGTKPLSDVLAPAIRLADEGFIVGPTLVTAVTDNFEALLADDASAAIFCPDGLPIEAGARLRNPDLARTLRRLATVGPDEFYRGALADVIARDMAAHGGFITSEDLRAYQTVIREPVRGRYRRHELLSAPPPAGGVSVIEALHMLDTFDMRRYPPLSATRVHVVAETLKRAFADYSAFVADPAYSNVPSVGLLSRTYARRRAADITPHRITPRVLAGEPDRASPSTTAVVVADRLGSMVALTQTLSDFFGAKVMVPGTGILLNNEVKNFSSRGVNVMAPGKRMRTTIAPTILLASGRPVMALATPGAARIISTMTLLVSNVVDYGQDIQAAIDAPRFYARDVEPVLHLEGRWPEDTIARLRALGYEVEIHNDYDLFFGGAQGIARTARGVLLGGADPRRDGAVVGY
ncbi:MAG: gamma-glutamyltransferase [Vicinamibacterales bacterium]